LSAAKATPLYVRFGWAGDAGLESNHVSNATLEFVIISQQLDVLDILCDDPKSGVRVDPTGKVTKLIKKGRFIACVLGEGDTCVCLIIVRASGR
jgi:hypothetical protein